MAEIDGRLLARHHAYDQFTGGMSGKITVRGALLDQIGARRQIGEAVDAICGGGVATQGQLPLEDTHRGPGQTRLVLLMNGVQIDILEDQAGDAADCWGR